MYVYIIVIKGHKIIQNSINFMLLRFSLSSSNGSPLPVCCKFLGNSIKWSDGFLTVVQARSSSPSFLILYERES